jgi:hypothetical protein
MMFGRAIADKNKMVFATFGAVLIEDCPFFNEAAFN